MGESLRHLKRENEARDRVLHRVWHLVFIHLLNHLKVPTFPMMCDQGNKALSYLDCQKTRTETVWSNPYGPSWTGTQVGSGARNLFQKGSFYLPESF